MNDLSKKASQAMIIEEDYVTLNQAKKLKEKGFDGECITAYYTIGEESETDYVYYDSPRNWNWAKNKASRPTHQMVLKWFREKHNVRVFISYVFGYYFIAWNHIAKKYIDSRNFATYEEATSAAIDYVLTNLI